MIKDDKGRLTKLDQIVEYQITTLPDRRWHLFFFTTTGETRKLACSFKTVEEALTFLKSSIEES